MFCRCSAGVWPVIHSLTPRGNPERPESGIYLKIFEKTQNLMNNLYHSGAQSMKKAGKWTLRLIFDPLEFCNIRDHLKITWIFKELGLCWFRYTLLLWRSSSFSKQKYWNHAILIIHVILSFLHKISFAMINIYCCEWPFIWIYARSNRTIEFFLFYWPQHESRAILLVLLLVHTSIHMLMYVRRALSD